MKPTIGRIVHVVLRDLTGGVIIRPGIVVRTWENADAPIHINAQVFMDGDGRTANDGLPNCVWKTSLIHDENIASPTPHTWHWPPRAES